MNPEVIKVASAFARFVEMADAGQLPETPPEKPDVADGAGYADIKNEVL